MIKRQALEICKLISKHRELNALVGYTRCIIAAPHAWYHSGSESQDEGPESFGDPTPDQQERYNTQQRSATELVWPATKQQEKCEPPLHLLAFMLLDFAFISTLS